MAISITSKTTLSIIVLSAALVIVSDYVWVLPVLVLLAVLFINYWKEEFIPLAFIIVSLVLVGDIIPQGRTILNYIGILVLIMSYIRKYGFKFPDKSIFLEPMYLWVYGLMCVFVFSMLSSRFTHLGISHLLRTVVFFAIIHLLYSFLREYKRPQLYISSYLIVAFLLTLNVWYGFVSSGFSIFSDEVNALQRISGLIENVNNLGTLLGLSIPFFVFRGYVSGDSKQKYTYYILACLVLLALFLTNTRSAFLTVIVYTPFYLYYLNRKVLKVLTASFAVVVLAFLLVDDLYQLLSLLFRLERLFSGREVLWETSINIISDRWLLGIGPGAFGLEAYNYLPVAIGSIGEETVRFQMSIIDIGHAHNFFLFYFSEMGIGGFILAILLPVVFLSIGAKNLKYYINKNREAYFTVLAIQGTGLGMFIRGLIEATNLASYGWLTGDLVFWLLFMIQSYYYNLMKYERKSENT